MVGDLRKWIRSAPEEIRECLLSAHLMCFLKERRSEAFQMQGRFDGDMSDGCKKLFAKEYETLTAILEELEQL